jgi:hypothetical protein
MAPRQKEALNAESTLASICKNFISLLLRWCISQREPCRVNLGLIGHASVCAAGG